MAVFTTVDDAGSFFNTILWTGNSPSTQALTGVGFQPDFVWVKKRSSAAAHCVTDSVRGVTKTLFPNDTAAEATRSAGLTAFGADGFTVGADGDFNGGSATFAGWNWKAGTTTGIDATGATITPTAYSFNATSGFSIITYTGNGSAGATIPHGLATSDIGLVLVKNITTSSWGVQQSTSPMGPTRFLYADEKQLVETNVDKWNDTAPTSVLVSLGTSSIVNTNTQAYVAYVLANVQGYSKFGFYVGNGDADGPFVYTGFRPALVWIKNINSATSNWVLLDNKRNTYNPDDTYFWTNETDGEGTGYGLNFFANGFKVLVTGSNTNGSGNDHIFMAYAEAPLVNSSGVAVNAR